MGMYVCQPCAAKYNLADESTVKGVTIPCEICGALDQDWSAKPVVWTRLLHRLWRRGGTPDDYKAHIQSELAEIAKNQAKV